MDQFVGDVRHALSARTLFSLLCNLYSHLLNHNYSHLEHSTEITPSRDMPHVLICYIEFCRSQLLAIIS